MKFKKDDRVLVKKPSSVDLTLTYHWIPNMDKYDGLEAVVVHVIGDYDEANSDFTAYSLDIDDEGYGWMGSFLVKR